MQAIANICICLFLASFGWGCGVRRTVTVESDPPGALVTINNVEVGRTPLQKDFTFYGTWDVQVRKEGYQTLRTQSPVIAPLWQWPPFDLLAEFMPFRPHDQVKLFYRLQAVTPVQDDPEQIIQRAGELRGKLQGPDPGS